MSKETIAVKAQEVEEVAEQLKSSVSAIVVDYRGLTVEQVTDLRKQLREAGVKMRVIKNKIMVRAADKAGFEDLNLYLLVLLPLPSLKKTQLLLQRSWLTSRRPLMPFN